ncbi:hypothetical protein [Limnospira platensis]|uniref:hypothetical protein n=1 Tax=Limnospira platensis TaxID=118562 RepID=UPI00126944BA|nr:hypothetical protein [Arthrospira platensis NCB002]
MATVFLTLLLAAPRLLVLSTSTKASVRQQLIIGYLFGWRYLTHPTGDVRCQSRSPRNELIAPLI